MEVREMQVKDLQVGDKFKFMPGVHVWEKVNNNVILNCKIDADEILYTIGLNCDVELVERKPLTFADLKPGQKFTLLDGNYGEWVKLERDTCTYNCFNANEYSIGSVSVDRPVALVDDKPEVTLEVDRWEYDIRVIHDEFNLLAKLREYGDKGWELVSIHSDHPYKHLLFKRKAKQEIGVNE
jgi:hypothetical protein